jgi:purine-binding chemotaxis protein CheW
MDANPASTDPSRVTPREGDRRESDSPRPGGVERRSAVADRRHDRNLQYATFVLDNQLLGVPVLQVQEVLTTREMTRVPLSPSVVAGLINLRGQIVMALDLRARLGFPSLAEGTEPINVVVQTAEGPVSLLVDRIADVIEVHPGLFAPTPETVDERLREVTDGVYILKDRLLLALNTEAATRVAVTV